MRWRSRTVTRLGSLRARKVFLWLPKTIGAETRWLECALVAERFTRVNVALKMGVPGIDFKWIAYAWRNR